MTIQGGKRMKRMVTVKDIAESANVSRTTIRRLVDSGHIEANRNYCGWRIFEDTECTVNKVKSLLYGTDERNVQIKRNS